MLRTWAKGTTITERVNGKDNAENMKVEPLS